MEVSDCVVGTAFFVSAKTYWGKRFFSQSCSFVITFSTKSFCNFAPSSKIFEQVCQNDILEGSWIFYGQKDLILKMKPFPSFFDRKAELVQTLGGDLWPGSGNCILKSEWILWRQINFFKKVRYHIHFLNFEQKKFWLLGKIFLQGWQNCSLRE